MIDAHLHLGLLKDPKALVERARSLGLTGFVTVNTNLADASKNVTLAENLGGWCSLGLHPKFAHGSVSEALDKLQDFASSKVVRAIGECGFDRRSVLDKKTQRDLFEGQLKIAQKLNKPVVLHLTCNYFEAVTLLKEFKVTAMVHFVSGSSEVIQSYIKEGFYLSFCATGRITQALEHAFSVCPVDKILIESDFDNVKEDQSLYDLKKHYLLLEKIAKVRSISVQSLENRIEENFDTLFGAS